LSISLSRKCLTNLAWSCGVPRRLGKGAKDQQLARHVVDAADVDARQLARDGQDGAEHGDAAPPACLTNHKILEFVADVY
jgi:hypothetical protein